MSFRFRKRVRIFPGIYLNIGKTGVSTTIGPRGANINIGKGGTYLNTGIPGTGLSWRNKLSENGQTGSEPPPLPHNDLPANGGVPPPLPLSASPSPDVTTLGADDYLGGVTTTEGLEELNQQLVHAREVRISLAKEIEDTKRQICELQANLKADEKSIFAKFLGNPKKYEEIKTRLNDLGATLPLLEEEYENCAAVINYCFDPIVEDQYQKLIDAYQKMARSQMIWDITSSAAANEAKSSVKYSVGRVPVRFALESIDYIKTKYPAIYLQNANGSDLYIFPGFILLANRDDPMSVVDLKELKFRFKTTRFIEADGDVPSDSIVIDKTWDKVNEDGTPDKRFKNNQQHPIVEYGALTFEFPNGLKEAYHASDVEATRIFSELFASYLNLFGGKNLDEANQSPEQRIDLPASSRVSEQYFRMLSETSEEFLKFFELIKGDEALLKCAKDTCKDSSTNPEDIIKSCICIDCARALKILSDDVSIENHCQKVALGFVVCVINGIADCGTGDYEKFLELEATLVVAANSILEFGSSEYPVSITVQIEGNTRNMDFAMPVVLLQCGNPNFDNYAVALCRFATVLAKSDGLVSENEELLLKDIYEKVHNPIPELRKGAAKIRASTGSQSLDDVLQELDALVGLSAVKEEVRTLINFAKIQKERGKLGLKNAEVSYHLVLTGSPGTGKTTVARIVSKIYNVLGILKKGQLVETDKSGLIAEYLGQTPVKVNRLVDSALDGVLFIDEAYSLAEEFMKDGYGKEAISTLIKRMEDDRERLVVMVAGYTQEMKRFVDSNSGLKSRFNKYIEFPDYTPEELLEIFERQCKALEYLVEEDARTMVASIFRLAYEKRDRAFGNGRYVRNIFEKVCERQANRVAGLSEISRNILVTIVADDIPKEQIT